MVITSLHIPDIKVVYPKVFEDERGYFYESFHKAIFSSFGIETDFVQDNQSCSGKGVLRGMHFQDPPHEQGKLVRIIKGAVLDVVVDLRKKSPYYGQWVSQVLSGENKLIMWIPPGFAHGFLTFEEENILCYKCTSYYNRDSERVILWNDPDLAISWGIPDPIISERDNNGIRFSSFESLF